MSKKKKVKKEVILVGYHPVYPSQPLFEKCGDESDSIVKLSQLLPREMDGSYNTKKAIRITIEEL